MVPVFLLGLDLFTSLVIWRVFCCHFRLAQILKNLEKRKLAGLQKRKIRIDLYDAAAALWANGMDYKA